MRQGELTTNPTYKNITAATTHYLKTGAGSLHRIIINNPLPAITMVVYDSTTAGGTTIATITLGAKAVSPITLEFGAPFSEGLTVTLDTISDVTFIYE